MNYTKKIYWFVAVPGYSKHPTTGSPRTIDPHVGFGFEEKQVLS